VQSDLSVAELVEMYGRYYIGPRPVDEVLELVELTAKRDVRTKELSGGQRRRLDHELALGRFSVAQPTLEDIYLELTGSGDHNADRQEALR
jgi:ABC-type transport system involved in cytochrome c biogenesis ATPase subunit